MYKFIYDFARDKAFKNLQMESALDLWELLLQSKCKFLADWLDFMRNEKKDLQVVQKDTWNMFLELIETTGGDFAKFQDDGTWPPIIDQFTEYYNKKH